MKNHLLLVNATHPYQGTPQELIDVGGGQLLEKECAQMFQALLSACHADHQILPVSGYRTHIEQAKLYADSVAENGLDFTKKFVAPAGTSEHETGLAIDVGENAAEIDFICPSFPPTGVCLSFLKQAPRFGFILRYPQGKEKITGISYEPWHFRYVGTPHAEIMSRFGMVLEEYLEFLHGFTAHAPFCLQTELGKTALYFTPDISDSLSEKSEIFKLDDGFVVASYFSQLDVCPKKHRAWAEIDLHQIDQNLISLRHLLPAQCQIMPVLKANANGHGMLALAKHLNGKVPCFAVSTLEEGVALREAGVCGEILVLGYTHPKDASVLSAYHLTQTLLSLHYAQALSEQGFDMNCHVKLDTGMHRLGESAQASYLAELYRLPHLTVTGTYTHLLMSDSLTAEAKACSQEQIQVFYRAIAALKDSGISPGRVHIQSSYGVLNYPELSCDCARVGVALFGTVASSRNASGIDFPASLSLRAEVALVRTLSAGESAGYNRSFQAHRDSRIAILSIGYADGLSRALSNSGAYCLLHGQRAPIVSNMCMNQLTVDVTDIPNVQPGDIATFIGQDGSEYISAIQLADWSNTIVPETTANLAESLPRIYHD